MAPHLCTKKTFVPTHSHPVTCVGKFMVVSLDRIVPIVLYNHNTRIFKLQGPSELLYKMIEKSLYSLQLPSPAMQEIR